MELAGTYTAIVTPFVGRGAVDEPTFRALLERQADARVDGVVVGGTTGESPGLSEKELERLFVLARETLPGRVDVVPATARNHLDGSLELTRAAADTGVSTVLLVDPYYNGPSSLEIRREHLEPIAERFPDLSLVPYVIPGRTGTRLEAVDVERLLADGRRIGGVKDATGEPGYARALRTRCPGLAILSGDDARTVEMIRDASVRAAGVISVVSNLVPEAVRTVVAAAREGDARTLERRGPMLEALFSAVSFTVEEPSPGGGTQVVRSRNPVPVKSALAALGVPVGGCRPPLGRLSPGGARHLAEILRRLNAAWPEALAPLADRFHLDLDARLGDRPWPREVVYDRL